MENHDLMQQTDIYTLTAFVVRYNTNNRLFSITYNTSMWRCRSLLYCIYGLIYSCKLLNFKQFIIISIIKND